MKEKEEKKEGTNEGIKIEELLFKCVHKAFI